MLTSALALDPYCPLQQPESDSECSHSLGTGVAAEAGRGYRLSEPQLAHSRGEGSDSFD